MSGHELVGSWELESWQARACADGRLLAEPFGPDPVGLLTYTGDGIVQGQMMRRDRPRFARPRRQGVELDIGQPEELAVAFNTFLAYAGRYHVDTARCIVRHELLVALVPGWQGMVLERRYTLTGDRLRLETPPRQVGDREQTGVLVWRRVRPAP